MKADAKAAGKELSEQQIKSQEAWEACAREMKILLPQLSEMRDVVRALNRTMLDFKVALQRSEDGGSVTVKVKVQNKDTNATTFLDTFEYTDMPHTILHYNVREALPVPARRPRSMGASRCH